MRRYNLHNAQISTPKRGGFFRLIKYLIIAAIMGSLFRLMLPAIGLFTTANNIGVLGGDNIIVGEGGGGIGAIGVPHSYYNIMTTTSNNQTAEIDATPLIKAAIDGNEKTVKKLLKDKIPINGRDSDGRTALIGAAYYGQNDICVQLLNAGAKLHLSDDKGFTALDFAAARGLVETVKLLLKNGNSADKKHYVEYAMLMQAAFASDIKLLPKLPRNINAFPSINRFSPEGKSPLHVAALNGSVDMVNELIIRGAKIELMTEGKQTPLHWAAWSNNIPVIYLLLKKSATVNVIDNAGVTPLMLAAEHGNKEAVMLLIEKGAKKDLKNSNNKDAATIAANHGFFDISAILQKP